MHALEAVPQPVDPQRHLVDLQYEEVSKTRTAVLNRESERMRGEGWSVQSAGDHLIATRLEDGRSQFERMLIAVGGFLALAYGATQFLASAVDVLPGSEAVFLVGAAALGAAIAFATRGQAARDRCVTVSVDGQGRPFQVEQGRDL
jgi:hypothetical protein